MALQAEQGSHASTTRAALPDIIDALETILGARLTAVVAGVSDAKAIGTWARGEGAPGPDAEQRLRDAYVVATLLLQAEGRSTIRVWFSGMNPSLDDRAPALVLGEDPDRVLQAARTFLAHG